MPQYAGETASTRSLGSSGGGHGSHNGGSVGGMIEGGSPNSSQLSVDGRESTLITRTQKQHITQNVTTTTKTIREVQYLGPDGQPLDFIPGENGPYDLNHAYDNNGQPGYRDMHYNMGGQYYPDYGRPPTPPTPSERSTSPTPAHWQKDFHRPAPAGSYGPPQSGYDELDTTLMPPRPGEPYRDNSSPGPVSEHPGYAGYPHEMQPSNRLISSSNQQISSSNQMLTSSNHSHHGRSSVTSSHISQHYNPHHDTDPTYGNHNYDPNLNNSVFEDSGEGFHYPGGVTPLPGTLGHNTPIPREAPRAVFDDEDEQEPSPIRPMMAQRPKSSSGSGSSNQTPGMSGMPGVQWRDPDLHEVIEFLTNPNAVIKANAAAYLQHLCYMDDPVKAKTRQLGGIPPLVALLSHDIPEIHRNSCGALRNLSFGRQNDENKRAIKAAGGTNALVRLLRKTADNEVKELVTGVLWNLSSCDDLKRTIIDEALLVLINIVIIPHSGWDRGGGGGETHWSTVFRNASGILRNVSSAGDYGRKKLRECEGLVDSLLYLVRSAIERANIDNKSVENAVCVLRNLSYRSQEVEDMNYDKRTLPVGETRAGAKPNNENLGCFGASKAKGSKGGVAGMGGASVNSSRGVRSGGPVSGMDLLWQPEVVQPYLNLLSNCSNPETLEAAAGGIQNLAACYWQPSIDIRAAVRKEKGLPILVELLRMEVDRVVCAVATALRNLAIDQRNKELIGKYAMRDLVQKLPSGNPQRDVGTSDETIAAVLATLNEVIKKHPEFSRSLLEAGGVDRLMNITRQRAKYTSRVVKFASQVLFSMWQHQELREVYRKSGWKEADFVTKTVAARNARPNSPTNLNSTLNRPMASQGGTRYEDRTMRASGGHGAGAHHANNSTGQAAYHPEDVAMENLSLYGGQGAPGGGAQGAGRAYHPGPHLGRPGEPVYAQVNRDKKRSRGGEGGPGGYQGGGYDQGFNDGDYSDQHWTVNDTQGQQLDAVQPQTNAAGDSWV